MTSKDKLFYLKGSGDLFADFQIKATSNKIRIISKMGGSIWKQEDPKTILMYNNENKVFIVQTIDKYVSDLDQGLIPIGIEELEGPASIQFRGRKAKLYRGFANVGKKGRRLVSELICLDNNCLSPATHRAWCRFLGVNRFDLGVPVAVAQLRLRVIGVKNNVLQMGNSVWVNVMRCDTISELPASSDNFSLPGRPGSWKRGKDKASLLFSTDGDLKAKDIDDLFRSDLK